MSRAASRVTGTVKDAAAKARETTTAATSKVGAASSVVGNLITDNDPTGITARLGAGAIDLRGSVKDDPKSALLMAANPGIAGAYYLGKRVYDDQKDQATGQAENEAARAAADAKAASDYAAALVPQAVDLAEIRRQRAAAYRRGASRPGALLGSTDTNAKTLLGV